MSSTDPNQPGDQPQGSTPYNPYGGAAPQPPAYGSNPYGQPDPSQQSNPYAQPPQYAYPPAGGYAPVQPPAERPRTLQLAFWLILAAGVVSALSSWLLDRTQFFAGIIRSEWDLFQSELRRQMEADPSLGNDPQLQQMLENPDQMMNAISGAMTAFTMVSIVLTLIAYFLVGFFVGRGVNAMRIIATILAALSLLGLLSVVPTIAMYANAADVGMLTSAYVASVLLGIAGVVCSWLRPSSQYIAQRRAARQAGYR
ncbi:hypothetical protein GcLGCM259_2204 [Glutamicibacter creatinolyticus]|uniref:Uncharacterized protein n=1 Tax=Glutamicibacter creatinolyticus TaxID=162496 RepID=A0A5B7WXH1_9MICC|nr:hypothetical protein [Glutamicibacter creatinolyticus]QCY47914.1 hypothetical protein GcLGCM259_2204 [Glutamicibacter creatinolyticus]